MADEPDPPRKYYEFKPREFDRVNPPRPPASEVPPPLAPRALDPSKPIDVRELFQQAQTGAPLLSRQRTADKTDVHAILSDNHARDNAAGLNELEVKPKRASKRKRDYWLMMGLATAIFGTAAVVSGASVLAGNRGSAIVFVYSLAALVMVNLALWWVMWHIVEDY